MADGEVLANPGSSETHAYYRDAWERASITEQCRCDEISEATKQLAKARKVAAAAASMVDAPPGGAVQPDEPVLALAPAPASNSLDALPLVPLRVPELGEQPQLAGAVRLHAVFQGRGDLLRSGAARAMCVAVAGPHNSHAVAPCLAPPACAATQHHDDDDVAVVAPDVLRAFYSGQGIFSSEGRKKKETTEVAWRQTSQKVYNNPSGWPDKVSYPRSCGPICESTLHGEQLAFQKALSTAIESHVRGASPAKKSGAPGPLKMFAGADLLFALRRDAPDGSSNAVAVEYLKAVEAHDKFARHPAKAAFVKLVCTAASGEPLVGAKVRVALASHIPPYEPRSSPMSVADCGVALVEELADVCAHYHSCASVTLVALDCVPASGVAEVAVVVVVEVVVVVVVVVVCSYIVVGSR